MIEGGSSGAFNIPIRATYPRQLIVYDDASGSWYPLSDSTEDNRRKLITLEYLAVSYRQSDFPNKVKLEEVVRNVCENRQLNAYWLDFACTGETQEEKNQDLYRIADVFRFAKETLIMIPDTSDEGWKSWGGRVWTYPEALISGKHLCKEGTRRVREIKLFEIDNLAYGKAEGEHRLAALYGTGGRDFSRYRDRVEDICLAIWSRNCGSGDSPSAASSSQLTALPGERVYALMGFLQRRIVPNSRETEKQAFDRLMEANGLRCGIYPWEAVARGEKFVVRNASGDPEDAAHAYPWPAIGTVGEKLKILEDLNISAAKYNSSQCAAKNTCEQGTRVTTLRSIYEWLEKDSSAEEESRSRVFWIYGLAGAGKSTIAKTVADYCDKRNILGATFFCSRFNSECSNKLDIFPTISYQLCQRDDGFKKGVFEALRLDKDLGRAELSTQLEKLVVKPLKTAQQMTGFTIVIDALDECLDDSSTSDLLKALNKHVSELTPLKFVIASRPEDNIRKGFHMLDLNAHLNKQNLSSISSQEVDDDIRLYLEKELSRIAFDLREPWPAEEDIEEIVKRTRGLFIFASTIVKFLEDKRFRDPVGQLRRFLNSTAPSSDISPYAHLDHLYTAILEEKLNNADESLLDKLKDVFSILSAAREPLTIRGLGEFMPETDIHGIFQDLHSLIFIPERDMEAVEAVRFIHPSFRDFLVDDKRSISRIVVKQPNDVITQCCAEQYFQIAEEWYNLFESLHPPYSKDDLKFITTWTGLYLQTDKQNGRTLERRLASDTKRNNMYKQQLLLTHNNMTPARENVNFNTLTYVFVNFYHHLMQFASENLKSLKTDAVIIRSLMERRKDFQIAIRFESVQSNVPITFIKRFEAATTHLTPFEIAMMKRRRAGYDPAIDKAEDRRAREELADTNFEMPKDATITLELVGNRLPRFVLDNAEDREAQVRLIEDTFILMMGKVTERLFTRTVFVHYKSV